MKRQSSLVERINGINPWPSVEVSMSKTPNPRFSRRAGWRLAWLTPPSFYECVCEWVNVRQYVKPFGGHKVYESTI